MLKITALCLSILLGLTGCASIRPSSALERHLERQDSEFLLLTKDATDVFRDFLTHQPKYSAYIGSVSTVSLPFGQRVSVEYETPASDRIVVARTEQQIVQGLSDAVENCQDSGTMVLVGQKEQPQLQHYMDLVRLEDPFATFGMESIECTFSVGSLTEDGVMNYQLSYVDTPENITDFKQQVRQKVAELSSTLWKKDDTPYQRIRLIHDYLIDTTVYDKKEESLLIDHTAYGPLVCGKSVCDGYAYAAEALFSEAGIENHLIEGTADGSNHIWNIVKLDGKWYHVDITWDDPVADNGQSYKEYDYFLIGDQTMAKDHIWESEYHCKEDYKRS